MGGGLPVDVVTAGLDEPPAIMLQRVRNGPPNLDAHFALIDLSKVH